MSCRTADTQRPTAPHFNKLPHEGADKLLTSNPPRVCFPSVRFKHLWCPTQGSSVTRSGPAARRPGAESETPAAASLRARGDEAELWEAHSHFLLVAEAWKITAVQARSGSHINRATSRWRQQVGMRPVVDGDGQGRRCSNSAAHSLVISLSRQSEHRLISSSCTARASLLTGILMMAPSADSDEV